MTLTEYSEAANRGVLWRKVIVKFRKFHRKTPIKKRLWHRCFPVKFVKFLRTPAVGASDDTHTQNTYIIFLLLLLLLLL